MLLCVHNTSPLQRFRSPATDVNDTASSDMIGRIPVINFNARQSELFFLRVLLYHKAGATGYVDLRTVDGEVQPTFQEACKKMGLLADECEVDQVMEEAALVKFGAQLRALLATILVFIRPANPLHFWEQHKHSLCEDLMHHDGVAQPTEEIVTKVLQDIQEHLERCSFSLTDFHLPIPDATILRNHGSKEVCEETSYDVGALQHFLQENLPKLNADQAQVFHAVMHSVDNSSGHVIGLDAPSGTGKTFLLSTLLAAVRSNRKVALATATSGIAATLLPNGRTLHSRCKVPLNIQDDSTCSITKQDSTAELIRQCHLVVIDEVTMANRRVYEAVDRTFRDIREDDTPFGGITMVLAGDWRQILPVVHRGGRPEIVDACLKSSALWQYVQVMKLSQNMRV